jgi:hypothetical protein
MTLVRENTEPSGRLAWAVMVRSSDASSGPEAFALSAPGVTAQVTVTEEAPIVVQVLARVPAF